MGRELSLSELALIRSRLFAAAEKASAHVARQGRALSPLESRIASQVGVIEVGRVRVLETDILQLGMDPVTNALAARVGLQLSASSGMCLGHQVFVRSGRYSPSLLAHELRHVAQFESSGGNLAHFLGLYLSEIVRHGYFNAPMEADARRHESIGMPS